MIPAFLMDLSNKTGQIAAAIAFPQVTVSAVPPRSTVRNLGSVSTLSSGYFQTNENCHHLGRQYQLKRISQQVRSLTIEG